MYDPTVGRFINLDPIGFTAGDTNTNRYVGNGVTYATDPTGTIAVKLKTRTPGKGNSLPAFVGEGDVTSDNRYDAVYEFTNWGGNSPWFMKQHVITKGTFTVVATDGTEEKTFVITINEDFDEGWVRGRNPQL